MSKRQKYQFVSKEKGNTLRDKMVEDLACTEYKNLKGEVDGSNIINILIEGCSGWNAMQDFEIINKWFDNCAVDETPEQFVLEDKIVIGG